MNRSNIEWTQFTINPVRTFCRHGCSYCYARRMAEKKRPAHLDALREYRDTQISWHPEVLKEVDVRKKPGVFFVGSMTDLFGAWVPKEYIHWILDTARKCPQHTFLFLTKNPMRYSDFVFPENCWRGTSVIKKDDWFLTGDKTFVSFEPLIGDRGDAILKLNVSSVIIGAMTGPGAVKPEKAWVEKLIEKAGDRPIFLKNNLLSLYPDLPRRQETAWILK